MERANLVLIVAIDDDHRMLELLSDSLSSDDVEVLACTDPEEGLRLVRARTPDIVLVDLVMPGRGGMEVLQEIVATNAAIDVVLITGNYSTESAVEAIQRGAADYLNKPVTVDDLRRRVGKLIDAARKRHCRYVIDSQAVEAYSFEGMVGRSPAMQDLFSQIGRIAPHYRTVLVTGETGTGKELVSRAIHQLSPVAAGPFVVCNCSAIVESLFESELFGYVRGAFTGAHQDKVGLWEAAHGGTLFLDEIGELPLSTQAKILRALQNGEIQRVGSTALRKVDVRVVAATNRNLTEMADAQQFRNDLYYRLSMVELHLPSLFDRAEDFPLLVRHFIARFGEQYRKCINGITVRAEALLARYTWPGNIRELENVIGHACMMAEGGIIDVRDLPERLRASRCAPTANRQDSLLLEDVERRHVLAVLNTFLGNKARAAEALGISRGTLYRLITNGGESDASSNTRLTPRPAKKPADLRSNPGRQL